LKSPGDLSDEKEYILVAVVNTVMEIALLVSTRRHLELETGTKKLLDSNF